MVTVLKKNIAGGLMLEQLKNSEHLFPLETQVQVRENTHVNLFCLFGDRLTSDKKAPSLTQDIYPLSLWVYGDDTSNPFTIEFNNGQFLSIPYQLVRQLIKDESSVANTKSEYNQMVKELSQNKRAFFISKNSEDGDYMYMLHFKLQGSDQRVSRPFNLTQKGPKNHSIPVFPDLPAFVEDSQKYPRYAQEC
jgi:hypothetical protein